MKKIILFSAIFCFTIFSADAVIRYVPSQYPTIQSGVNAANPGDTVMVAAGTYYENVMLADNVRLIGAGMNVCTIDGSGTGDVVTALQINNVYIEGFTVRNSEQSGGSPGNIGIFINPQSSAGTKIVRNCRITECGKGIDIWNDFGSNAYIEHNLLDNNIYDGFSPYLGNAYLTNNTIVDNGRDGYNDWSGGGFVQIQNNIFANNGRYGIFKHQNTPVFISYNDVWNNDGGAYYQGYSGPYTPFTPNPGTGEISADPLFYGGQPFDYHLTWENFPTPDQTKSPCIDAGNPATPHDPDNTAADMGAFYFNQTVYNVVLGGWPALPIQIPSTGGSFDYDVQITNNENFPVELNVWIESETLGRVIINPVSATLPSNGQVIRARQQNVPGGFLPVGTYDYTLKIGSFPQPVWDSEFLIIEIVNPQDKITQKSRFSIFPNPFNPETMISLELKVSGETSLIIYDVQGRETAVLMGGFHLPGNYEFNFNASHLPSSIYFARLHVGNEEVTQKLMLLK